ncbi:MULTISPECIES: PadR family transcriptional regulator [unclassified Paenibacillus]|uniref:PadR family transcriptional regulator n=1 Tax=unclassified Paenibacillus TaxID=185978 RepID=UPI00278A8E4E|nr:MULTISPECIES: transcriptional regulator [unclassified Paenibacillus]MDQ0896361.1 DNA-binding PadR family transcriptional regulator [Paenibacillus sp. V4I7]MDQ0914096.1 DNA-binding PadR family transcriptional regulator [Paenibacillus sp. V4I5]
MVLHRKRPFESVNKTNKVSRILKVQEFIDFFVLAEISQQPRYVRELDELMVKKLQGVGVNVSYMSKRLDFMEQEGYITRYWDNEDKRHNHYCKITDTGTEYFKKLLQSVPDKVNEALTFYKSLHNYIDKYGKINFIK